MSSFMKKVSVFLFCFMIAMIVDVSAEELNGEIEMSTVGGGEMIQAVGPLAKEFMKLHPQVKINLVQEPEGGQMAALIAAGDAPDIFTGSFGYMSAKYAEMDSLVPLETLPGADELFNSLDPAFIHKDFGHIYYVPWFLTTQLMIYNKELFKEAGLDPDKPPETFEEALDAAKKIYALPPRADGTKVYGFVFWNDALTWGGWAWSLWAPLYYNFNDGKYQLMNKLGTDVVFDRNPAKMQEFFDWCMKAQQYAPKNMRQSFFTRSIGMWTQFGFSWSPHLKTAKDRPMVIGEDVGLAPMPTLIKGGKHWSNLDGRSLMIFKSNKNKEKIAWEFVKFLMLKENNLRLCKELGQLPSITSLKDNEFFKRTENKPFIEQLPNSLPNEPFAVVDEVAVQICNVYQEAVVKKNMNAKKAVKEAAGRAREAIKKKMKK